MSGIQTHVHNNGACQNCGHSRAFHEKERVYDERGPPGSYHYEYTECPDGSGTFSAVDDSLFDGANLPKR